MKKLLMTSALIMAGSFTMAQAASDTMTVSAALNGADETTAVLKGTLGKSLGHEKYEFSDASGSMTVEIDRDITRHITLNSGQSVTLYGEIEQEHNGNELEVDFLEVN